MDVAAVILAGGKSTRMGRDKAFMTWKGRTFLQIIVDEVIPLNIPIYLSGQKDKLNECNLPVIEDNVADQGPVMALSTCFNAINASRFLVVSCDIPQIQSKELNRLIRSHHNVDVTMFKSGNRAMPLAAIYENTCLTAFSRSVEKGERRLFSVLENLKTKTITYSGELRNVNSPQDLLLIS